MHKAKIFGYVAGMILVMGLGIGCSQKKESALSKVTVIASMDAFNAVLEESMTHLVMVDFYADWCAPCRMLSPLIEQIAVENKNRVALYKVNVDKSPDIAQKYNVSSIPHVVYIRNKNEAKSYIGLQPREVYIQGIVDYAR